MSPEILFDMLVQYLRCCLIIGALVTYFITSWSTSPDGKRLGVYHHQLIQIHLTL
jgi:hypothetical protein